jgi:hypothetical protein
MSEQSKVAFAAQKSGRASAVPEAFFHGYCEENNFKTQIIITSLGAKPSGSGQEQPVTATDARREKMTLNISK